MMARLKLSLLGPFQASLDGLPVTGFESNKVRALLAYLAVEALRPHSREALATLLWPDWPQGPALTYLRNALADLRQALNEYHAHTPYLLVTHDTLQFNPAWRIAQAMTRFLRGAYFATKQSPSISRRSQVPASKCKQLIQHRLVAAG
jgi:DNA-binding SARP family transcriptional activator